MTHSGPKAETHRVRALIHLVRKDLPQARLEIAKSMELGGAVGNVRFTAAVIDYFSALSKAAVPDQLVAWPEPVDWAYIKGDSESLLRLQKAGEVFDQLSEQSGRSEGEQLNYSVWHLACLGNHQDRQAEAAAACQAILGRSPTYYPAIVWAFARRYDVDLDQSEAALSELMEAESVDPLDILGLVSCYLTAGQPELAVGLLGEKRPAFSASGTDSAWALWYARSLASSQEPDSVLQTMADSEPHLTPEAKAILLHALSERTGERRGLLQHLEHSYAQTSDPMYLLDLCRIMAEDEEWSYIADRADLLRKQIGTTEALTLAAGASYNADRFSLCHELLGDIQSRFDHKLPIHLRRMRVACQRELGLFPDAISEAEALAREAPMADELLALAQLYSDVGDLRRLAATAERLRTVEDVPAVSCLQIARLVQWEDRDLAREFWRKAASSGLGDELVGEALSVGYQLGLDAELRPLLSRMVQLGQEGLGGIQIATIQDLYTHSRRARDQASELTRIYQEGTVPIHLLADRLGLSLADLYHGRLEAHRVSPDPLQYPALLVLHGGHARAQDQAKNATKWRLNLDITALLLAAHLDLLPLVTTTFRPLRIPAETIPLLIQMREQASPQQPARLDVLRHLVKLVDAGAARLVELGRAATPVDPEIFAQLGVDFATSYSEAHDSGGYVVCSAPLHRRGLSSEPPLLPLDAHRYLVSPHGVAHALWTHGPLSRNRHIGAVDALGPEQVPVTGARTFPAIGSHLYCDIGILEALISARVADITCKNFTVHIAESEYRAAQGELKASEQREELAGWLGSLVTRISRGLECRDYEFLTQPAVPEPATGDAQKKGPLLGCLVALLRFIPEEHDVIWADDRYITGYLRRDAVPIVSVCDVLQALRSLGAIELDDYYAKLTALRAGNCRFIPVDSEEIIYHLRQARVENDQVLETDELSVLRRYVAASLLQSDTLQYPTSSEHPGKIGEAAYPLGLVSAVIGAIEAAWSDQMLDPSVRDAYTGWILGGLYVNHLTVRRLSRLPQDEVNRLYLVAITLADLVSRAITMSLDALGAEDTLRRNYLDWLSNGILARRFDADPFIVEVTAEIVKALFTREGKTTKGENEEAAWTWFLQDLYGDLPERLQDQLSLDTDFMARIGIRPLRTVQVGDLRFEADSFFRAASATVNGRSGSAREVHSDEVVVFEAVRDAAPPGTLRYSHPLTGETQLYASQDLELLLDSPSRREALLRSNRHWFDCGAAELDRAVAEIASIEDASARMDQLALWRESSAAVYYERLYQHIRESRSLDLPGLEPPSADGLLRHLRLSSVAGSGRRVSEEFSAAAQRLVTEEGLYEALCRLVGLPVPLPAVVLDAIGGLAPEERRSIVKKLIRTAGSPLSQLHLVHLLLHCDDDSETYRRLAIRIVSRMPSSGFVNDLQAFAAILAWVADRFSRRPDMQDLLASTRLALTWIHSHTLYSMLAGLGAPSDWIREFFGEIHTGIPSETFAREPNCWFDVCHPTRLTSAGFLICGLDYALGRRKAEIIGEPWREQLADLSFRRFKGGRMPIPALLRDTTGAQDTLSSFLGGDLGSKSQGLLPADDAPALSQESLHGVAEHALEALDSAKDGDYGWSLLYAVMGDLPPHGDLEERFRSLIRSTSFTALFNRDDIVGHIAIQLAASQVRYLGEASIEDHVRSQLIQLAHLIATMEDDQTGKADQVLSRQQDLARSLIESALNIAAARPNPEEAARCFAAILMELVEAWESLSAVCAPAVQALAQGLPVAQAEDFWHLLLRLRAGKGRWVQRAQPSDRPESETTPKRGT